MKEQIFYCNDCCVYPGEYARPRNVKIEKTEWTGHKKRLGSVISETENNYRIEISVPGRSHEDFLVTASQDKLHVEAIWFHPDGRKYEFIDQNFPLPPNIDTDFATAEYKGGKLVFCFPKTNLPANCRLHELVIY